MSLAIASLNRYHTDAYASAGKESITQTSEPQYSHNPTRVQWEGIVNLWKNIITKWNGNNDKTEYKIMRFLI